MRQADRIARAARRVSQKDLATESGLNANYISLIEAEQRAPSARVVEEVGRALRIPPHLMALLAADESELNNLSSEQAATLGRDLLTVLTSQTSLGE